MIESLGVRVPAEAAGKFYFPGSTVYADSYFGIQKDPGHCVKSAGGRLQLNTHAPYVCGFA